MSDLKLRKLGSISLYSKNDKNETSNLQITVRDGYPRLTVYINRGDSASTTGIENMIIARAKHMDLMSLCEMIEDVIDGPKGEYQTFLHRNVEWKDGVRQDKIVLEAKTHVGKTKEGVVFIMVEDVLRPEKPKIKFPIINGEFTDMEKHQTPIQKELSSLRYSRAFVKSLRYYLLRVSSIHDVEYNTKLLEPK